jgi:thiamine biosynthesis lipoprotein
VDLGVEATRAAGSGPVLLEAGGDLFAAGRPEAGSRWTIGVRDPVRVQGIAARFEVEDEAVATSGTYFQRRTVDGRSVSHLIDPHTGSPSERVLSSTIVARDCMTADALATATAVMEPGAALDLVSSLPAVEGLWIYPDRSFRATPGLASRLEWV